MYHIVFWGTLEVKQSVQVETHATKAEHLLSNYHHTLVKHFLHSLSKAPFEIRICIDKSVKGHLCCLISIQPSNSTAFQLLIQVTSCLAECNVDMKRQGLCMAAAAMSACNFMAKAE